MITNWWIAPSVLSAKPYEKPLIYLGLWEHWACSYYVIDTDSESWHGMFPFKYLAKDYDTLCKYKLEQSI